LNEKVKALFFNLAPAAKNKRQGKQGNPPNPDKENS
jgi:hypothetical protein